MNEYFCDWLIQSLVDICFSILLRISHPVLRFKVAGSQRYHTAVHAAIFRLTLICHIALALDK